jgi:hypothetical protein
VLLTRTWGLHVDEIIYFHLAINNVAGEALWTGKPFLFYTLNYVVYHLFAWCTGWLHPLILPLFYATSTAYALWRMTVTATKAGAQPVMMFTLLLLSPFVLFNATQLMTESAMLPMVTATFAILLSIACDYSTPGTMFWLGATAAIAILVKDTAIPAGMILALAFVPALGFAVWPLVIGIVVGTAGSRFLR